MMKKTALSLALIGVLTLALLPAPTVEAYQGICFNCVALFGYEYCYEYAGVGRTVCQVVNGKCYLLLIGKDCTTGLRTTR